jgi:hypothetical protein
MVTTVAATPPAAIHRRLGRPLLTHTVRSVHIHPEGENMADTTATPASSDTADNTEMSDVAPSAVDAVAENVDIDELFDADIDGETLPPPELPSVYLDTERESLTDSPEFADHLTEHWGF